MKFKDVLLSNYELINWCKYLDIPIKGVFSRNEEKPLPHSPCIANMDDLGSLGTHWVCRWHSKNDDYEYWKRRASFAMINNCNRSKVWGSEDIVMEVYYVKDKWKNSNVEGTEKVILTKNNRKMLKVKCTVCGLTKTRFLPGNWLGFSLILLARQATYSWRKVCCILPRKTSKLAVIMPLRQWEIRFYKRKWPIV